MGLGLYHNITLTTTRTTDYNFVMKAQALLLKNPGLKILAVPQNSIDSGSMANRSHTLGDIFRSDQTLTTGKLIGQNYGEFFQKPSHFGRRIKSGCL